MGTPTFAPAIAPAVAVAPAPTITLADVFEPHALDAALADGYVRRQAHPTEPLAILNYTEKAAYEGVWNPVTLACRGLIHHTGTSEVIARPFRKFFNYGQAGAPSLAPDAAVTVTDKLDGSLGVLYSLPSGGWAVATRGSFASEQAQHATALFAARYGSFTPPAGWTLLYEIVYPANRIVIDYGSTDDLILLGAVEIATGRSVDPAGVPSWPGPVTDTLGYATLAEALAVDPRPNREGLVVHVTGSDERVKLKQEDYVALHRIVTGLNARTVWQALVDGQPLAELIAPLPDEFHGWVRDVAAAIEQQVTTSLRRLVADFEKLCGQLPDDWDQADRRGRAVFAKFAAAQPEPWAMFALLDGRDIRPKLLAAARPEAFVTPSGRVITEDNN